MKKPKTLLTIGIILFVLQFISFYGSAQSHIVQTTGELNFALAFGSACGSVGSVFFMIAGFICLILHFKNYKEEIDPMLVSLMEQCQPCPEEHIEDIKNYLVHFHKSCYAEFYYNLKLTDEDLKTLIVDAKEYLNEYINGFYFPVACLCEKKCLNHILVHKRFYKRQVDFYKIETYLRTGKKPNF